MTELAGGVCVVTGAGAGLGRALVDAFAAQDMRVVLADVSAERLAVAAAELDAAGVECLTRVVDVRDLAQVDALAEATVERFGGVSVICNNAGVSVMGKQWEITAADWDYVLDVCLDGVIHGIRSFVPRILATREATGRAGHVVNVASMGGLLSSGYMGPYGAAKHAVVGLSKGLRVELQGRGVGVSVVCPGLMRTEIAEGMRDHMVESGVRTEAEADHMVSNLRVGMAAAGMDASAAAEMVVRGVLADRFWILPNGASHLESVRADMDELFAAGDDPGAQG
ncbi:MAG: SDR family NAD(P)-dependent oxidoreductase [Acidimicrobiia bacterium]